MIKNPDWTPAEDQYLLEWGPHNPGPVNRTLRARTTRLYILRKLQKKPGHGSTPAPFPQCSFGGVFPKLAPQPPTFSEDRVERGNEHWERQHRELSKKYSEAMKELSLVDRLVESARDMAPVSYQALPPAIPPAVRDADGTPQSALLHLSDQHVGLVVKPEQTNGMGDYNFGKYLDRLASIEDSVRSILTNHVTVPIEELVIVHGGDLVNGCLDHSAESGQPNTVFAQVFGAAHSTAQFIRNLAPLFPKIRNYCVQGNHGRWKNQSKPPTDNRYSNLDSFGYALISALTRDLPGVEWQIDEQPVADFEVQGHRILALHGDVFRGGDRSSLGLPAHAIGRHLAAQAQLYAKAGRVPPAYVLSAHLHRPWEIPSATGAVLINGGFPGADTYSLAAAFTPADPVQRFLFLHRKFGETATYKLSLKFAIPGAGDRYVIPEGISIE
jgi:hypothetical protein